MQDFKPRKGLALVLHTKQSPSENVKSKNGLLLPTQKSEDTLLWGTIHLVDDPEGNFKDGDKIAVVPDDIIGEFNTDAGKSFIVDVNNILGKVEG